MKTFNLLKKYHISNDGKKVSFTIDDDLFDTLKKNKVLKKREFWYEIVWDTTNKLNFTEERINSLIKPFLVELAPVIWRLGLHVTCTYGEKDFFENLTLLRNAYRTIWKELPFLGSINPLFNKAVSQNNNVSDFENIQTQKGSGISLYSGGVDSISSLINHIDDISTLLTFIGGDIALNDTKGHATVKNKSLSLAKKLNKDSVGIISNFQDLLKYKYLDNYLPKSCIWWTCIQHGPLFASYALSVAELLGANTCYIPSTHNEKFLTRIGSRPDLETTLSNRNVRIIHDGIDLTRQGKLEKITSSDLFKDIHVCYTAFEFENCGVCEKCLMTACGLIALKKFDFLHHNFPSLSPDVIYDELNKKFSNLNQHFDWGDAAFWEDIKNSIKDGDDYGKYSTIVNFLKNIDFYNFYCRSNELQKVLILDGVKIKKINIASL